ncbi:ABC-type polysaccharide/polyol phosphate transport system, ATPase component [Belliella buryatensis]|uniref:ABC-type polysaccharide/polyol phosphate transport system, ATPase component n=1 Tax=Belliella buryatensis TaxID=1500549 RepID=A0A239CVC1_9BACT|nr:polysaccharide ABC transporter ATP-binding protein [Belliella buryatensis]SNS23611.1 ABC-type polysaccharide/polyol phosphate transport system, ATPase component [Belliella buryatensis]
MSNTIIKVENLSKRYRIGLQEKKADTLAQQLWTNFKAPIENFKRIKSLGKFEEESDSVHWALKNVSFEVKQGEVLGIIGKNGAGKSTLLKILSKITEPTSGRIEMNGRVAALLEVGTGFHPELTGRENIYMNGTILGMTKKEIDRKLDEIINFSGVEKYVDTPVKFYSSGMRVRLGFSVAAHLEPEILIIDEVLAVGDYEFQQKCLGKMEDVSQKEGRTVLFVSHNMDAISNLCKKSILLNSGALEYIDNTEYVLRKYLALDLNSSNTYIDKSNNEFSKISRIIINTSDPNGFHNYGKELVIEFYIKSIDEIPNATLSFQLIDEKNRAIMHCWLFQSDYFFCNDDGVYKAICKIKSPKLYMGKYFLTAHFGEGKGGKKYQTLEKVCSFEIHMHGIKREFDWAPYACTYLEDFNWYVEKLD